MRFCNFYSHPTTNHLTGRSPVALHYIGHVCEVIYPYMSSIANPAFRYVPGSDTSSSIQLSSKYPLNLFYRLQNTLRKGGLGPGPPQKKSQKGWLSYGILLQKSEMFVFPDSSRNFNLRCHAGCYSSSSWLKQIAPVGRSNHRVTHGTLVHYDLGSECRGEKSKKSVKLMVWMFSRCQQVKVSLGCASKVGRYLLLVVFNQVSKIKEKTKTYSDLLC